MQTVKVVGFMPQLIKAQLWISIPIPTSDFSGQTVIITGSNTGLGLEAARHIVRLGAAKVILAVRTIPKGEAAARDIVATSGVPASRVEVWRLDMADVDSIKAFAKRAETLHRLDAVLLNAGVMSKNWTMVGDLEYHIAINTVGTLLLVSLLLPTMQASARRTAQRGRMSVVGSDLMYIADLAEIETTHRILHQLSDPELSRSWMSQRYAQSKILVFWAMRELAARNPPSPESNVVISVMTPGACESDIFRDESDRVTKAVVRFMKAGFARTGEVGGRALVHAISPDLENEIHGKFLMNGAIGYDGLNVTSAQGRRLAATWNAEVFAKLPELVSGVSKA